MGSVRAKMAFAECGSLPSNETLIPLCYAYNIAGWNNHKLGEAPIDIPPHMQRVPAADANGIDTRC